MRAALKLFPPSTLYGFVFQFLNWRQPTNFIKRDAVPPERGFCRVAALSAQDRDVVTRRAIQMASMHRGVGLFDMPGEGRGIKQRRRMAILSKSSFKGLQLIRICRKVDSQTFIVLCSGRYEVRHLDRGQETRSYAAHERLSTKGQNR